MLILNLIAIAVCAVGVRTFTRTARATASGGGVAFLVRARYGVAALMAAGAVVSTAALMVGRA
jgi:hypothetical protein